MKDISSVILQQLETLETHMGVYRSLHEELDTAVNACEKEEDKHEQDNEQYYDFDIEVDDLRAKPERGAI